MAETYIHGKELRDLKVQKGTGLTVGVASGNWSISGIEGYYAGVTNQAVTDNATNYIEMDATGTLSTNTTSFTAGYLHLATVITSGGTITSIVDKRTFVTNAGAGIGTGIWVQGTPTGTINGSNTTFTIPSAPDGGSLLLVLDGKLLDPGGSDDYTLSGTTITFNTAPATGSKLSYFYTISTPVSPSPAQDIATATTTVNVAASAAPVVGYVLVASDDENAAWDKVYAHGLKNASGNVAGDASAAPSVGQTLRATSGTTMEWSNPIPLVYGAAGTSATMAVNTGYIPTAGGLVILTLPAVAPVGSYFGVSGFGSGGWRIAQDAGQNIIFDGNSTTVGTGGRMDSANRYNSVTLLCVVANTTFKVIASDGTPTLT